MVRDRATSVFCRISRFLPNLNFPLRLSETLAGAELVIVAVPVAGLRSTLQQIAISRTQSSGDLGV